MENSDRKVMEKVMESHGILIVSKSTNPVLVQFELLWFCQHVG